MENEIIFAKNLVKSFRDFVAVDKLDFSIRKSECFGFLGPNGAGKTTTLRVLYGLTEPDNSKETSIDVMGFDPRIDSLKIKAMSGIVPQSDNLDSELNVTDNLMVYSRFYGMSKQEAKVRISELLSFMELGEKANAKIRELSGGMQRRLTIARALLNRPQLLILDEPTTGLDPQVRHMIWNKLRELKEQGVTILLTTHYMEEAFQICDRILIMDKGKKIIEGVPRELLSQNIEKFVMEVYGLCKSSYECKANINLLNVRHEFFNDTMFVYSNSYETLAEISKNLEQKDYYIRHSNLEDLFLKVTGRSLNELQ